MSRYLRAIRTGLLTGVSMVFCAVAILWPLHVFVDPVPHNYLIEAPLAIFGFGFCAGYFFHLA